MAGSKQKHDMRLQLAAVAATHAIGWRGGTEQDGHFAILRLDYARTPTLPLLSPMVLCSRRCRCCIPARPAHQWASCGFGAMLECRPWLASRIGFSVQFWRIRLSCCC
jgi:hypothetical protein